MNSSRVVALLVGVLLAPPYVAGNPVIYERSMQSVALIVSTRDKVESIGTGTLVNEKERIILTNYHVVGEGNSVVVFFPAFKGNELITTPFHYLNNRDKIGIVGKVIARAKDRDLAIVKLPLLGPGHHEMPLATRSALPGETLHAVGNSGIATGALWRYSKGEVRQVFFKKFKSGPPKEEIEIEARVVETQMPINKGDSGGPGINARGELAAVNQGYQDDTKQRLVSTMIDIAEVRNFLKKENLLPGKTSASK